MSESIKRLTLPIETVLFVKNCLASRDAALILDSFSLHYQSLKKLSFAGNSIGVAGCQRLSDICSAMKCLKELKLNECKISDKGASVLLSQLADLPNLKILDLSGNLLGQSSFSTEMAKNFALFLQDNKEVFELYLDDNNLRGAIGEQILTAISHCHLMRVVSISKNFLGQTTKGLQPPIDVLSDMLVRSSHLKRLDISWNKIEAKSIFCIAKGLSLSKSVEYVSVEGNPIG